MIERRGHRSVIPSLTRMVAALALAGVMTISPTAAAGLRGRWFLEGTLGYHAFSDSVPNNADLSADPRPDDFASREISLDDSLTYSIAAGFGMTEHITLQLDAGWLRSDLGPVDVYSIGSFPIASNPLDPVNVTSFGTREASLPTSAGVLTQIPVSLTGTYRFRKDRPLRPYIGAGFGMVFTGWETDGDVDRLNERLRGLRIRSVSEEHGRDITPPAYIDLKGIGRVPMEHPVSVEVDDGREWHLTAGVEYAVSDRVSFIVDARYTYTNQAIVIDLGGEDQVTFNIWSEQLFRADGSLRYFRNNGGFPNPYVDPNDVTKGIYTCTVRTTGDFDHDGHRDDLCYDGLLGNPVGSLLVQGGRINLNNFWARLGVRFYF